MSYFNAIRLLDRAGTPQGVDASHGIVPVKDDPVIELLESILLELRAISQILHEGLNIQEELKDIREDAENEADKEELEHY